MLEQNLKQMTKSDLPPIPDKRYFAIGEVSQLCGVKPHVLRYWEQEFKQLKPSKRRGNRRYYQRKDVLMVRKIRELLYEKGFTIGGARQQLLAQPTMVIEKPQATIPQHEVSPQAARPVIPPPPIQEQKIQTQAIPPQQQLPEVKTQHVATEIIATSIRDLEEVINLLEDDVSQLS